MEKYAVYVTADKNFALQALVTIFSIRRFFPNAGFFVVGDYDESEVEVAMFEKHGIEYIRDPWVKDLRPYTPYKHLITYSMLSAPQLLYEKGFSHCLGLDADVMCVRHFEIEKIFRETKNFAGIANQRHITSNWSGKSFVSEALSSNQELSNSLTNPNAGILFFSCSWAQEFGLREKGDSLLKEFGSEILSGDQGLLAAIIYQSSLRYNTLGAEYNLRLDNKDDAVYLGKLSFPLFVHFTGPKPWDDRNFGLLPSTKNRARQHWKRQWLELQREALKGAS